jgi:diaminopimelate decarboxylase
MIRINPDIAAKTHKHISTGTYANKFGIAFSDVLTFHSDLIQLKNINLIGLHYHIGSQITDFSVFQALTQKINYHYKQLNKLNINLTDLNFGGGLGINYTNPEKEPIANFSTYFKTIATNLDVPSHIKLHFELGRSIIAQCGTLVTRVLFTKQTAGINFVIIDAGMNDLLRPALYGAKHKIVKLSPNNTDIVIKAHTNKYHIVGPICESTDIFAKNLLLPTLKRGDKLLIYSTGAYGKVLANQYNSRGLIKEFLI